MKKFLLTLGVASLLATPALAQTARQSGAEAGANVAGRVGAAVGGIVGSAVGVITDDDRPRFRHYVEERHVHPYRYDGDVVVGATLPADGVEYYEVPSDYKVTKYRYTVVNDRTVLVDPATHRVVEVID